MQMLTKTYYDHGVLKDPQQQLAQQQAAQLAPQASYSASDATASDGSGGETPVLIVAPPVTKEGLQLEPPMSASSAVDSASLLDTSSTIVRPRPQPKRLVSNYYSPLLEAPQHQLIHDNAKNHHHINNQNHHIIVQPSHLRRDEEPLPPQLFLAQQTPMQLAQASQPMQGLAGGDSEPVSLVLQQQQPNMGSTLADAAVNQESLPVALRPPIPLKASEPEGQQELLSNVLVEGAPIQQLEAMVQQQQPQAAMARNRHSKNSGGGRNRHGRVGSEASTTVVYYYDPRDVTTDSRAGQLMVHQLPSIVYDSNGNPHWLSTIRAKEIVLEAPPPPVSLAQQASPATESTSTATSAMMVKAGGGGSGGSKSSSSSNSNSAGLGGGPLPQWGESTATDQSIIVCTVGIMALLVGAVSARRFRRQSFLSACIENEALDSQHDDTALQYGTGGPNAASSSYRTFEGWRGDLEKFDV
jgi:hypothetical protein